MNRIEWKNAWKGLFYKYYISQQTHYTASFLSSSNLGKQNNYCMNDCYETIKISAILWMLMLYIFVTHLYGNSLPIYRKYLQHLNCLTFFHNTEFVQISQQKPVNKSVFCRIKIFTFPKKKNLKNEKIWCGENFLQ